MEELRVFANDGLPVYNGSEASSLSTDLSLRAKSQSTSTSIFMPMDDKSLSLLCVGKDKEDRSLSDGDTSSGSRTSVVERRPALEDIPSGEAVLRLSTANMKKHDLEQEMSEDPASRLARILLKDNPKRRRRRKRRNGVKKVKLPGVESLMERTFPLPSPQQIERYSHEEDSVHLAPRELPDESSSMS